MARVALLPKSTLSIWEAATVSAICFGLFIVWSTQAVLRGFPEARFSASAHAWMVIVEGILAASALLYLRARNFDVGSLYPQPICGARSWVLDSSLQLGWPASLPSRH